MAKSNNAFLKKQRDDKRRKKKQDKEEKKKIRKENAPGGELENMMAYVDEFGNISNQPPEAPTLVKQTNSIINNKVKQ